MGKPVSEYIDMMEGAQGTVDRKPHISDGKYEAVFDQAEIYSNIYSKGEKLALWMRVFRDPKNPDDYVLLARHLNYSVPPSPGSDFYREWVKANYGKHPKRSNRWPLSIFKDKRFLVRVETVDKDGAGDPLEGDLCYSKIAKLLKVVGKEGADDQADNSCPF